MKYYLILILIALLLVPGVAIASDITDALYYGNIQVSNNGTTATLVSVNMSLGSENLIDTYGVDTNFDYVAIRNTGGDDVPFMPSINSSYPWCLWVPSINENSSLNDVIYTGQSDLSATKYYFPGDGGMTVSDNTTLELGDNFSIEYSGYIDTNYVDYVIGKDLSFSIQTENVSSNITAGFPDEVNPTGFSDPTAQWSNETNTYDDNTGSFAFDNLGAPGWSGNLTLTHSAINVSGIRIWLTDANDNPADKVDIALYYNNDSHVIYNGDYTRGVWNYFSAGGLQAGVTAIHLRMYGDMAGGEQVQVYEVDYYGSISPCVTSNQDPGDYHIKVEADGTNLYLYVDDMVTPVDTNVLGGASATDNDNDWQIGDDDSTPYIETANVTVNGTLRGSWHWEYATTFTDLSGNGNDATPTFRTASSDPDVTATLISFQPVSEASAEYSLGLDWPTMITTAPDQPATMYSENSTPGVFFAGFINTIWTPSGIPVSFFWYNFTFATIIISGILVFRMNQSLLLKTIIMATVMIAWALPGPNVYGLYVVIYFAMYSAGILILSRSYGW